MADSKCDGTATSGAGAETPVPLTSVTERKQLAEAISYAERHPLFDDEKFTVRAEIPGVALGDIRISVEGQKLTIAGERKLEDEEGVSYHRRERPAGTFDRTLTLPAPFAADGVRARYEHGVLTINLPLAEAARARQIEVVQA